MTFSKKVNQLFFGVDVSNKSASLIDSFHSLSHLEHKTNNFRQYDLNTSIEMESVNSWTSQHEFIFTKSPLPDLIIKKGTIEMTIGETDSTKKLLNLNYNLQFDDKASATKYFDKLKQIFGDLATKKKFEKDKYVLEIAQFSTSNPIDKGIRDLTLILAKSTLTKKYEITLWLASEFMNKKLRHTTKGLASCRRTETQSSTLVHVASVVPSLTDIAEQQILTSTN